MNVLSELLQLVNTVRAHRERPPLSALRAEMTLRDDLHLDSLDLAELTVRIEEKFGVDVFREGVVRQWGEIEARVERHVVCRT